MQEVNSVHNCDYAKGLRTPLWFAEDAVERHSGPVPATTFGNLPPNTLLTTTEVAEWLKVARRQVQRLGIPWIDLGRKTPRYQVKDVLAWLETRRREAGLRQASLT